MIRISERDRIGPFGGYDVGVPAKMTSVQSLTDELQPIGRPIQVLDGQPLLCASFWILNPPDHANPSGLVGPVRRAGKAYAEAAMLTAGFKAPLHVPGSLRCFVILA